MMMSTLFLSTALVTFVTTPEFHVESCIEEPFYLVETVNPRWPIYGRSKREGSIDLTVTVNKDGSIIKNIITYAEPRRLFDKVAKRAISEWKFNKSEFEERCFKMTFNFILDTLE